MMMFWKKKEPNPDTERPVTSHSFEDYKDETPVPFVPAVSVDQTPIKRLMYTKDGKFKPAKTKEVREYLEREGWKQIKKDQEI